MNFRLTYSLSQILQILISVYALLYVLFIISSFVSKKYILNPEGIGVYSLFILFFIAYTFMWINKLVTGLLLLTWNAGMWIIELFFVKIGNGFGIAMGIPLILLAVFFIFESIEKRRDIPLKKSEKWKIGVRILTITYTVLYMIVLANDLGGHLKLDFLHFPGIFLILLFALYLTGFAWYWKNEFYAGILFVIWYAGVLLMFIINSEFATSGPWVIAGIVVLINGAIFLKNEKERRERLNSLHF